MTTTPEFSLPGKKTGKQSGNGFSSFSILQRFNPVGHGLLPVVAWLALAWLSAFGAACFWH